MDVKKVGMNNVKPMRRPEQPEGMRDFQLLSEKTTGCDKLTLGVAILEPYTTYTFKMKSKEDFEVYYLLKGKIRISWNGKELEAKSRDAVLLPPGWILTVQNQDEETTLVYVANYNGTALL